MVMTLAMVGGFLLVPILLLWLPEGAQLNGHSQGGGG